MASWFAHSSFTPFGSFGTSRSAGVLCLVKRTSAITVSRQFSSDDGRVVVLDMELDSHRFQLATIYAPNHNPEKTDFFLGLSDLLDPLADVLILGDFNSVVDPDLDRVSSVPLHSSYDCSGVISQMMEDFGLVDAWRHVNPNTRQYSFFSNSGLSRSRIDLACLPQDCNIKSCHMFVCPHSDHSAVGVNFSFSSECFHGPGLWKLNTSILENDEYKMLIADFWCKWQARRHLYQSCLVWWDLGKAHIKRLTISFSSKIKRRKSLRRTSLENRLAILKRAIDSGDVSCLVEFNQIKTSLSELDSEEARAAYVRSRLRWIEDGEQSNSFFLRLERQNKQKQNISSIKDSSGVLHSYISEMLGVWRAFYQNLFSGLTVDPEMQETFFSSLERRLSQEDSASCEGPLTPDECLSALRGMASNKTPGVDGLPKEFYLTFWDTLGPDLVSVLNSAHDSGLLSYSQRHGAITLIFKKGSKPECKNYRPISLLCVDYKIASRVICGRLRGVIGSIVSEDQTCCVPGRFIGENIRLLQDAVTYSTETDQPLALLSLDQEKAFDRVDWSYLFSLLDRLGFGPNFISWVRLFYTDPRASILVNGFITEPFQLFRGVRQGCPLSASLYVLIAESLACRLRASPVLGGLTLPLGGDRALISQYADDTTLLLTSDFQICTVFKVYADYELASGAKLNMSKCKGLWCGSWAGRTSPPVDLQWSSSQLDCLGVTVGPGDLTNLNWDSRLESLSRCLHSWRQRALTLSGKALVANTLALSGLWYTASVVCMPEPVAKSIRSLVFSFFWSGGRDLVKRSSMILPTGQGGFGLVDPALKTLSLHAFWVKRFGSPGGKWRHFFPVLL